MKYLIRFSAIALILLQFGSCGEDFVSLEPIGTQTEANFYQTEDEIFQGLLAVYDVLTWTNGWNMTLGLDNAASDDCFAGGSGPGDQPSWVAYDAFTLNSEIGPQEGLWNKYYSGIARANLLLEKIDENETISDEFRARVIAETKFLRGFYYFDLGNYFGRAILTTSRISPDDILSQQQVSQEEIYNQAISDFRDAYNTFELPTTVAPSDIGRVTKGAAQGYLAKALLYQGGEANLQEAATLFDNLIESGLYALESDYGQIFSPLNEWGVESIFEIQHSDNQRGGWGNFPNGLEGNFNVQFFGMRDYQGSELITVDHGAGWSFCPVTPDLVDFLSGDPRMEHTIIDGNDLKLKGATYTEGYQNTDYFIRKYTPLESIRALDGEPALNWRNNEIKMRLADVYLLAAEAHALTNNLSQANTYVNRVRSRVGLFPGNPGGLDNVLNFIRGERRRELATEGHRFLDLVRWGLAPEVLDGFVAGKHEFLPIPQREIDLSGGVLTQNAGY